MIRINDQQYWLYAAVDPATNRFLHIRLFTTYTTALTEIFLGELREKHNVDDAVFLVDDADWLKTALQRRGLDFRYELHGNRNSVERIFREVKRRTSFFQTTLATPNQKHGYEPSLSGTMLLTKHDHIDILLRLKAEESRPQLGY